MTIALGIVIGGAIGYMLDRYDDPTHDWTGAQAALVLIYGMFGGTLGVLVP